MEAARGPIFVVGSNGSGSTLLRLMLDSHEHIAIPEETGFLRLAAMHAWVPYWKLGKDWYRSLGLTEDSMYAEVARFYDGLFASYAASRGKLRWGDKTPFHVWHIDLAMRLFPDATVVGIVRHPAASASSQRRRFRRPIGRGTTHWLRSNRQLLYAGSTLGDHFVLLRYEDLVTEPERVMRVLLDRLGEPWSEAVLAHHEVQPAATSTGFTRTDRAIDTSSVRDWESDLSADELKRVTARTVQLSGFLGYRPDTAVPAEPLPILSGHDLAKRKAAAKDIDWSAPKPRAEDRALRPPAPRRGQQPADLSAVTLRDVLAHRMRRR